MTIKDYTHRDIDQECFESIKHQATCNSVKPRLKRWHLGMPENWDYSYKFMYAPEYKACPMTEWVASGGIIPEPTLSNKYPHLKEQVELNKQKEEQWRIKNLI